MEKSDEKEKQIEDIRKMTEKILGKKMSVEKIRQLIATYKMLESGGYDVLSPEEFQDVSFAASTQIKQYVLKSMSSVPQRVSNKNPWDIKILLGKEND